MSYRLDGWQDITFVDDYELGRRFDREVMQLADDLRVCGITYPSFRKDIIRAIAAEQARRQNLGSGCAYPGCGDPKRPDCARHTAGYAQNGRYFAQSLTNHEFEGRRP